jgi:DNA repair protein RadC
MVMKKEMCVLREELLTLGPERLSDVQLLGIVLGSPSLARTLISVADNWQGLGRADLEKRCGLVRVAQVLALSELSVRLSAKKLRSGSRFSCSEDITGVYLPRLSMKKQEVFIVLSLDNRNCVLAEHEVARGTLTQVEVHPREVFRELVRDGAARAIAVHNHPSGDPAPSPQDIVISRRLYEVGELVGITLLDFIIVASNGSTSFRDLGLIGAA